MKLIPEIIFSDCRKEAINTSAFDEILIDQNSSRLMVTPRYL